MASLIARIFKSVLLTHHFHQPRKQARVTSLLKPGKDPSLPSSSRPISLLDTAGKLFEEILLALILHGVNECGLMRDEHNQEFRRKEAHRRSFPRRGQILRYSLYRWYSLQSNASQIPFYHSPNNLIVPQESDVRAPFIYSRHAGCCCSRGIYVPIFFSLYVNDLPHTRTTSSWPSTRRHGNYSHVTQAEAACQLRGILTQRNLTFVE